MDRVPVQRGGFSASERITLSARIHIGRAPASDQNSEDPLARLRQRAGALFRFGMGAVVIDDLRFAWVIQ
jgi:hypothetical protein